MPTIHFPAAQTITIPVPSPGGVQTTRRKLEIWVSWKENIPKPWPSSSSTVWCGRVQASDSQPQNPASFANSDEPLSNLNSGDRDFLCLVFLSLVFAVTLQEDCTLFIFSPYPEALWCQLSVSPGAGWSISPRQLPAVTADNNNNNNLNSLKYPFRGLSLCRHWTIH